MSSSRAAQAADKSDPDRNPAFRGWSVRHLPLHDAAALNRLADLELAAGRFHAADRLGWLAEVAR
jgi:hypothetical protein